jgi:hypothetical protein
MVAVPKRPLLAMTEYYVILNDGRTIRFNAEKASETTKMVEFTNGDTVVRAFQKKDILLWSAIA